MINLSDVGRMTYNDNRAHSYYMMHCKTRDYIERAHSYYMMHWLVRDYIEFSAGLSALEKIVYTDWKNPIRRYWKYKQYNIF